MHHISSPGAITSKEKSLEGPVQRHHKYKTLGEIVTFDFIEGKWHDWSKIILGKIF